MERDAGLAALGADRGQELDRLGRPRAELGRQVVGRARRWGCDAHQDGEPLAARRVEHLVELVHVVDHEMLDRIDLVGGLDRRARLHGMHEVALGVAELLAHLRDLGQRGGIEMPDAGLVERLEDQRLRVALHGVEHTAGERLEELARRRLHGAVAHAIDRIAGLERGDHRIGVGIAALRRSESAAVAIRLGRQLQSHDPSHSRGARRDNASTVFGPQCLQRIMSIFCRCAGFFPSRDNRRCRVGGRILGPVRTNRGD